MNPKQTSCDQPRSNDVSPLIPSSATHQKGAAIRASFLTLIALSLLTLALAAPALAATEGVVYSFASPPDAYGPQCSLVLDTAGNLYGTTFSGGAHNVGAVFKVSSTGTESVVYSFAGGSDGSHPIADLVRDAKTGYLYGTTIYGGTTNSGTVFVVNPATGVETVLYSFKGGVDGANPYSRVVRSGATIFGTTNSGGAFGYGTIFKLTAKGKETILHSFNSAFPTLDGSYPYAGLTLYKGALYGTTTMGGESNLGTIFSITTTGAYTLLYSFKGGANDGQNPYAGVAFDKTGVLYGTTYSGGTDNAGTVYKSAGGTEAVVYNFLRNGADGINPYAGLVLYKGNFYGTTTGGNATGGTVYEITPAGAESILHTFAGGADGYNPFSALVLGTGKTFYSTTAIGGTSSLGTIFSLKP
jgi:uncharacterized repeat protein (TIGR03803 family)